MKNWTFLLLPLVMTFSLSCQAQAKPEEQKAQLSSVENKIKEQKMKIEIWSDVMCPFCYIGKRNFETALAQFPQREHIEVVWKSFQLDGSIPEVADETYENYLIKRKGLSAEQVQGMLKNVTESAKQVGLDYNFEQAQMVNSHKAHELIQMAKAHQLGDEAEERLFKAFFTEGKSIADIETLVSLGQEIGLDATAVREALDKKTYANHVQQDIQEARQIGVSGVPFFVLDRKYAVSGAQPPQAFLETLEKAFTEWRKLNPESTLEVVQGQACTPEGACD